MAFSLQEVPERTQAVPAPLLVKSEARPPRVVTLSASSLAFHLVSLSVAMGVLWLMGRAIQWMSGSVMHFLHVPNWGAFLVLGGLFSGLPYLMLVLSLRSDRNLNSSSFLSFSAPFLVLGPAISALTLFSISVCGTLVAHGFATLLDFSNWCIHAVQG